MLLHVACARQYENISPGHVIESETFTAVWVAVKSRFFAVEQIAVPQLRTVAGERLMQVWL